MRTSQEPHNNNLSTPQVKRGYRQPKRAPNINQGCPLRSTGKNTESQRTRISKRYYIFSPPARKCTTQVRYTVMESCRSLCVPTSPTIALQHRQETQNQAPNSGHAPPPPVQRPGVRCGHETFQQTPNTRAFFLRRATHHNMSSRTSA